MAELGYRVALYPTSLLNVYLPAAQQVLQTLQRDGHSRALHDGMIDLHGINELLGVAELLARGERYDKA